MSVSRISYAFKVATISSARCTGISLGSTLVRAEISWYEKVPFLFGKIEVFNIDGN